MQTDNLELKKLVYLYLINYAKSQPDLTIMAVNIFVKDSQDPNPLIRALAVRTMGCVRVDKITEYLCDPLASCLKDDDPYVRKTAAICVAKLFDINAELVQDRGFVDTLKEMLGDANPMVVANAGAGHGIPPPPSPSFVPPCPTINHCLVPSLSLPCPLCPDRLPFVRQPSSGIDLGFCSANEARHLPWTLG